MPKLWQVAVFEFQRNVWKKSFLIMLLSVPCLITISVGMGLYLEWNRDSSTQDVGIVDQAGILENSSVFSTYKSIWEQETERRSMFTVFRTEREAGAALDGGAIQVYFIIPEHYRKTRQVQVVYTAEPVDGTWQGLYMLLRLNQFSNQPPEIAQRVVSGVQFMVRSVDGRRRLPESSAPTFGLLFPLYIAIAFLTLLVMASGYTMSAVADEKENRTMEILITTLSPLQLLGGKLLGILGISLTLLATWMGVVAAGSLVCQAAGVNWFRDLSLDWSSVLSTILVAIPAYVLATAIMVAIGALVPTVQEGQSISTIFFVLHFSPLYLSVLFIKDPHSSFATILSVLPFTSLMSVAARNLFTIVPAWQVFTSLLVQGGCILVTVWLASRAFRQGMLRYGKRLPVWRLLGRS